MADERRCEAPDCEIDFTPKRSTARFCSTTCRQRANRAAKAAEHHATEESKTGTDAEHGLVKAVRGELAKANALDTVDGQVALQLARRAANPAEPGLVNLVKEIRAVVADAIGSAPKPTGGASADSDGPAEAEDEVDAARRKREEARKAAGLS